MIRSGCSSLTRVSASPKTSRPSASVLPISTVRPLREASTSPGRKELLEIAFSTAGTRQCSRTLSPPPMISSASASACAAPPMSFFINFMPLADLTSSPPESKHTPLPTMPSTGSPGLPQVRCRSRGAWLRVAARPTAWIIGYSCSSASPRTTVNSPWCVLARRSACSSRAAGPMSSAGVLTRSRTRHTARASAIAPSILPASLVRSTRGPVGLSGFL